MMHSTQLSCVRAVLLFWHSQISGFEGIGKYFDSRLFYTTNNISYFTTSLSENITSLSDLHFLNNIGIYCMGESNRKCCYLIIADFFVRLLKQPQGNQRAADCRKVRGSRLRPNMLVLHRSLRCHAVFLLQSGTLKERMSEKGLIRWHFTLMSSEPLQQIVAPNKFCANQPSFHISLAVCYFYWSFNFSKLFCL